MAINIIEEVAQRLPLVCPESHKIAQGAVKIFIEDAIMDSSGAFAGVDERVQVRAATYLAAHYCFMNLYQHNQSFPDGNFRNVKPGETGSVSEGEVKAIEYKDKKMEFFEKRKTNTTGQALVSWGAKTDASTNLLSGTTYGQEYLRLLNTYTTTDPFLVGNDPRSDLGRDLTGVPGDRYWRW